MQVYYKIKLFDASMLKLNCFFNFQPTMGSAWSSPDVKYLVVRTLPSDGIDEYLIVPKSWTRQQSNQDTTIAYPKEDLMDTLIRVENNEDCSKDWNTYRVAVMDCAGEFCHLLFLLITS